MVCTAGCGVEMRPHLDALLFENHPIGVKNIQVDNKGYDVIGQYDSESGGLEYFLLIICPPEDSTVRPETYPATTYIRGYEINYKAEKNQLTASFHFYFSNNIPDIVNCPIALNTIHFVDDHGDIVWSKTVAELGIKLSDVTSEEIIRPILEKLIRENVQPQEPETEESL